MTKSVAVFRWRVGVWELLEGATDQHQPHVFGAQESRSFYGPPEVHWEYPEDSTYSRYRDHGRTSVSKPVSELSQGCSPAIQAQIRALLLSEPVEPLWYLEMLAGLMLPIYT